MDIERRKEGNLTVAKVLQQRVDVRTAPEMKRELTEMIAAGDCLIGLDVSDVEFIDSSGLGAIVAALKQIDGRGDLVIVGAKPCVANLLHVTCMDKVFRMFADADGAVAELSA